jgi:hypothetical protein
VAPEARKQPAFDPEAYAARLDASHASLAPLVRPSVETLKAWKAGEMLAALSHFGAQRRSLDMAQWRRRRY